MLLVVEIQVSMYKNSQRERISNGNVAPNRKKILVGHVISSSTLQKQEKKLLCELNKVVTDRGAQRKQLYASALTGTVS